MASGDVPSLPHNAPPHPAPESLFDALQAALKPFSDYCDAGHQGFCDNLNSGVLLAVLLPLSMLVWRLVKDQIWRMLAWLGGQPGFAKLALSAYRREVAARYGSLLNIYIGRMETLSLGDVFVPLNVYDPKADLGENRSTRQILTDPQQRRLVLLGAPGSGKSTLLKSWATGVSQRESMELREAVPVFVSLRSYAQSQPEQSLFDWLVNKELPGLHLRNPRHLLQTLLANGRLLLLLDGLDEVAANRLEFVNKAVSAFLAQDKTQQCRIWLTCREQNYHDLPERDHYTLEGFKTYRVAELKEAQIREIVRRREAEFKLKEKSPAHYLEQVFQRGDILQLHRNPLLLTLSMGVYLNQPGDDIPHKLAEFYQQAIDNLLQRHDFQKTQDKKENRFRKDDKRHLLQSFAKDNLLQATAEHRDFETFPFAAIATTGKALAEQGVVHFAPNQARDAALEIKERAGLFSATEDGQEFVFAHRSLNEYCAAAALIEEIDGLAIVAAQMGNPAWRQVCVFYAAIDHPNAVRLVETLRDAARSQNHINLLALAGHCAAALAQPRKELRLDILSGLIDALVYSCRIDDFGLRGIVLKSLLELGNSGGKEIRQRLDSSMRIFIEDRQADQLIREISYLDTSVALQFLGYLANSDNVERKQAALHCLGDIEGQEKIPLLWRLLLDFEPIDKDGYSVRRALSQLLIMMPEPGAVERLNECEFNHEDNQALRNMVVKSYPFLKKSDPITPFALALYWAKKNKIQPSGCAKPGDIHWLQFIETALMRKSENEQKEWERLPKDKVSWTPKLNTYFLGKLIFWIPLVGGYLMIMAIVTDVIYAILSYIFIVFPAGLVTIPIIKLNELVREKMSLELNIDIYPKWIRSLFETPSWELGNTIFLGMILIPFYMTGIYIDSAILGALGVALYNSSQILLSLTTGACIFLLPSCAFFAPNKVLYPLGKPNRYLGLYNIPGVERWLPPEEK